MKWFQLSVEDILKEFSTDPDAGLTVEVVNERIQEYGPNELPQPETESLLKKFFHQFTDVLILVLIVATIVSFAFGEYLDAIVIMIIVVLNGILGFVQEYKAEKSLEALKKMSAQFAMVIRDDKKQRIAVEELVPGDVVELNAGDKVPADCRIIEGFGLNAQEAILTGESLPVSKTTEAISAEHVALGDQQNMLFKDTIVAKGHGKAVVVATGEDTEVGKISTMLSSQETRQTPLQEELDKVGKKLSIAAGVIIVIVFLVGILVHTAGIGEMFLTAVALAVAAIPEGLPAVVTIVLSIGVTRMAKQHAIVKKLPAVETLGATSIICSDKTGTLTQNRIRLAEVVLRNEKKSFSDYQSQENIPAELESLLRIGVLNSDASITKNEDGSYDEVGDQTEVALLIAADQLGMDVATMEDDYSTLYEIPFDSEKKYMVSVLQKEGSDNVSILIKGAPEVLLSLAQLSAEDKTYWNQAVNDLAQEGLRTLGFGMKELSKDDWDAISANEEKIVEGFSFIGMVGERDPLRPEVIDALNTAKKAGIKTVMITGDHKLTALSIAKELGLASNESEVLTGSELANMDDDALRNKIESIHVYARVNPEQKLRLVKMYQEVTSAKIAVTGDGVNDAPAIKAGDIGVAMGIEGTDVTREVADLVLEDDNYATIVTAVKEGRVIFANLVKFIRYLISCNISEIFIVFFAILLGYPAPLLPIQLLWVNLVTDGLPALALGMDSPESDVMDQAPRDDSEGILTKSRWLHMSLEGLVMGLGALAAFMYIDVHYGDDIARTVAFTTLSLSQLVHALNNRSEHLSIFALGLFTNKKLLMTIAGSAILQMLVVYTDIGNLLLEAVPLPLPILLMTMAFAFLPLAYVEIRKTIGHARYNREAQESK